MELFRSLGSLAEPPGEEIQRLAGILDLGSAPAAEQHTDLFLFQLYPFASVYLDREGKLGGEARDRIAGFWRALSLSPPAEPDHLTLLLAFYSQLQDHESQATTDARERWLHVRTAFFWEHLMSWLPIYLDKLRELAPPFYGDWASLLAAALREEATQLPQAEQLPLHLRSAPELEDPRQGEAADFLDSLLSPVRCGFILVRDDLRRAGQELQLGVRAGERRYVLKSLLGQEDRATLDWLAREANSWSERHLSWAEVSGPIARFWSSRAAASARLLSELAADL